MTINIKKSLLALAGALALAGGAQAADLNSVIKGITAARSTPHATNTVTRRKPWNFWVLSQI